LIAQKLELLKLLLMCFVILQGYCSYGTVDWWMLLFTLLVFIDCARRHRFLYVRDGTGVGDRYSKCLSFSSASLECERRTKW